VLARLTERVLCARGLGLGEGVKLLQLPLVLQVILCRQHALGGVAGGKLPRDQHRARIVVVVIAEGVGVKSATGVTLVA